MDVSVGVAVCDDAGLRLGVSDDVGVEDGVEVCMGVGVAVGVGLGDVLELNF